MGVIYIFMALAVLMLVVGTVIAAFIIDWLVMKRVMARRDHGLILAGLLGWVVNLLLFWSSFYNSGDTWLLYGIGLALSLLILWPFARRRRPI